MGDGIGNVWVVAFLRERVLAGRAAGHQEAAVLWVGRLSGRSVGEGKKAC